MRDTSNTGILFEMLQSFVSMAKTLNLSHSAKALGVTRQTVHRHIAALEKYHGKKLFDTRGRGYQLTAHGQSCLHGAEQLLASGRSWLSGEITQSDGLLSIKNAHDTSQPYFLHQHPLSSLWDTASPFLRQCFKLWAEAEGHVEHKAFEPVRDYAMLYRRQNDAWICIHVGSKSSYAFWLGWEMEKSSVGYAITELPMGAKFSNLVLPPFEDVFKAGSARFDHIYTQVSRTPGGPELPVSYHRLCMPGRLPNKSFVLISIIERTRKVDIKDFEQSQLPRMSADLEMDGRPIE